MKSLSTLIYTLSLILLIMPIARSHVYDETDSNHNHLSDNKNKDTNLNEHQKGKARKKGCKGPGCSGKF